AVWATIAGALGALDRILDVETDRERFQAWVRELARPVAERLGWAPAFGEGELLGQTRQIVLSVLGLLGDDADVQARARRLLGNRDVNTLTWAFVKREWDRLVERFPDDSIPRLLGGVVTLSTAEQAADVEAFVAAHPVPQAAKTVEQHLERLRVNVALREREAERIAQHLAG